MKVVGWSNVKSRRFHLKSEVSDDASSCCFRENDITQSVNGPLFRVSVLLSMELDSKFDGTAFSSPFTGAIIGAIRENIFTSIFLLSKMFSSSHLNSWWGRFFQIRDKKVWWLLTLPVSCDTVREKTTRSVVSKNLWFQAKTAQLSIRLFLRFHLWNRNYIADASRSYIIPKLQRQ